MSVKLYEGEHFGKEIRALENDCFKWTLNSYESGTIVQKHHHENNYLSLLINGNYNEKNKYENTIIETGSLIFRPSQYSHCHDLKVNHYSAFNIEFKENWKQQVDFNFKLPSKSIIYKAGCFSSVYKLFYYFINNYTEDFLSEFVLDWLVEVNKNPLLNTSLPWLKKTKEILEKELDVHHTIQSISEKVFIHPIYLAGAFKKKTGSTIGEYQMKVKLEKAVLLLFNTKKPVNEIAFEAGFYDAAHLINSFRAVYQTTPNKFRALRKS
jgi:AraC-like DNA-binding protein